MTMDYECPTCGEWLEIDEFQTQGACHECQNAFIVDRDGEFTDGMWRDRTKLLPMPQIPNAMIKNNGNTATPTERAGKITSDVALELMTALEAIHRIIIDAVAATMPKVDEAKRILSAEKQQKIEREQQVKD